MALNLLRNTRLFVSTVSTGTGLTNFNTWEIPVQADFSFSQANETQDITVNEAGAAPVRGSARFNTALNPVDWSFGSYMRPYKTYTLQNGGELMSCIERIMWHGLVSPNTPDFTDGSNTECEGTSSKFHIDVSASNAHKFTTLTFYIKADSQWYKITGVQVNQAEVDFALDGLGSITWSGFGTGMAEISAPSFTTTGAQTLATPSINASGVLTFGTLTTAPVAGQAITINGTMSTGTIGGTAVQANTYYVIANPAPTVTSCAISATQGGTAVTSTASTGAFTGTTVTLSSPRVREYSSPVVVTGNTASTTMDRADYIVQKYSTLTFTKNGSTSYTVPITGGTLTLNNNITFLTPETLGVVNTPIGSFTGSREISGTLSCYLRTGGTGDTGDLLNDLLTSSSVTTNSHTITFSAGGASDPRVVFDLPHAHVSIPTLDVQDVLSLNIDFKALPHNGLSGASRATSIEATNDISIDYYASTKTTDTDDLGQ